MTIGAIYRPPSADFYKSLEELAYILQQLPKKFTHIIGDFNVDLHKDTSCEVKEFESIMLTNGFLPLISIHTHEKPGCNKSCIDNVFTNSINDYITSGTISKIISHHLPIFFYI